MGCVCFNERSSRGLTILEMMLALSLFAVGTVAAVELFQRAQMGSDDGEAILTATYLAQRRLEELRNATYANLANEAKARVATPSGFTRFCRQVDVTSSLANLKQLTVTMTWDAPDCLANTNPNNVVLQTYRSSI